MLLYLYFQGQSSLVDHIRKSYSTNDLRVGEDTVDGHHPSFMLDDDELGTFNTTFFIYNVYWSNHAVLIVLFGARTIKNI